MTQGDLKEILEAGDVEACLAFFEHATEDERKFTCRSACRADWPSACGPVVGRGDFGSQAA